MRNESSCKGKVSKQAKSSVCKKQKSGDNQAHEEIISEEKLIERNGIFGEKKVYLSMYLQLFFEKRIIRKSPRTLRDLAQYIYDKKDLYMHKKNGYKLLELSSIITELNTLSKSIKEKLKKEKEEAKKNKSKYY